MKQWFVLRAESGLTARYHSDGGAVVYAENAADAVALAAEAAIKAGAEEQLTVTSCEPLNPDVGIYVFPDAGCC